MINFPDSLYYKIKDKKCILFLGSGATVQSGGCFGEDLSRYIYGQINTEIKFSKDLAKYTQLLVGSGYREEIEKIIRKRFSKQKPSESFRKISSLPWKAIYTTNYDDLIEKSYEKQDYYQYVNEDIENPGYMYNDNDIPLYKLNGDIRKAFDEKHPLIITMTDLKKSKIANERIVSRLTDDLNDTFVFIGYSFQDKIITDILDCFMATPRWESIKEKYIVSPELSEDDELQLSIYNIKHIKASSDDFFDYLDNRSQSDYQIKLQRIKAMVTKNSPLSGLKPRTINNILECFEYYNPESLYPSDGKYFYRGGNADWGIIIKEYDISRKLKVVDLKTKTCTDYTSYDVHRIFSDIHNTGIKKVLLCGPAVSGKTTTLYRIAYNLIKENILCLVFKQQANYKRGILKDVNQQIHSGFVVFIDNLTINIGEIHKMIEEATENNIPITFCMATRFSEWQNSVNEFNKAKLEPVNYQVEMEDFIEEIECEKLLSKLSEINLVTISNKAEKSAMIKKFSTSKNLIKILLEIIDRSNISKSICSEYEDLSPEAKMAYGLVSQTYQYDLMIKWEVLRRAIEKNLFLNGMTLLRK